MAKKGALRDQIYSLKEFVERDDLFERQWLFDGAGEPLMPVWIHGPLCLVCKGENVIKRDEPGIVAWNSNGPVPGTVRRDVCLDCERRDAERLRAFGERCREVLANR